VQFFSIVYAAILQINFGPQIPVAYKLQDVCHLKLSVRRGPGCRHYVSLGLVYELSLPWHDIGQQLEYRIGLVLHISHTRP
jgi:hypothetical protein